MADLITGLGGPAGFGEGVLPTSDDGFSGFISLASIFPTGIDFFGRTYTGIYVNNNGSITFTEGLAAFTPTAITGDTSTPIIAPFWADVDTRGTGTGTSPGGTSAGTNRVYYDLDATKGKVIVTWDDVGYYQNHTDKKNAFQLVITRTGEGDFNFEFRYENVDWVAGDESGGSGGLGGTGARAGYSAGDGINFFELPASGNETELLALETSSNVDTPGLWVFKVRDGYPGVAVRVGDATVAEGATGDRHQLVFVVQLSEPSEDTISVDYSTEGVTATPGDAPGRDFIPKIGTLTFAPGETRKEIVVEVRGDYLNESDETLRVLLSNPSNVFLADKEGAGLIREDDGLVVSARPTIEPRSDGTINAEFEVRLLSPSNQVVEVTYRARDGSARDQLDYLAAVGTLVFEPGQTFKIVSVPVLGDALVEADETFDLVLSDAVNSSILVGVATTRIYDEDNPEPAPPAPPQIETTLPEAQGVQADPEPVADPDRQSYTSPDFHYDAPTRRWSIPGIDANVEQLGDQAIAFYREARKEIVSAFVQALQERYVKSPAARALLDVFREFPEKKKFIDNFYDNITGESFKALDLVVEDGTEEESVSIFQRLEGFKEEAKEKGVKELGKDLIGEALNAIRVKFANSDVSLNVDVDFREAKAPIASAPGHHDIFLGSGGADSVSLNDLDDFAWGGDGDDRIAGDDGDDRIAGSDGNDQLSGGNGNDLLDGGDGNDTLNGGPGSDSMRGGTGDDVYVVDSARDRILDTGGVDSVRSTIGYILGSGLENLTLAGSGAINGTGNSAANILIGNASANVLTGASGDDHLDGGEGADTLDGGPGNDTYTIGAGDKVVESSATGGTDTVRSAVSHLLAANVEHLVLTGTAAIDATGNELANSLTGNSAANVLDGGGGADSLTGGGGDDTYVVDAGDQVIESSASGGVDTVRSAISYTLGANLENLVLTGAAAINATGNSLANLLTGNGAANILDGGAGADTLSGGGGNDIYVVGTGDQIVEASGGGTDTVRTALTHALTANVENLILTGTAAINGTGNALANVLTGNGAANILDGGAGADTLSGGAGNDIYVVGIGDQVVESSAGGTDTVRASISYTLTSNVENLVLTGTDAINATGNSLNNSLSGNGAANVLNGGAGADSMNGGAGDDTYVVGTGDSVVESSATGGRDTVRSTVSFTLGANLENLVLIGTSSTNGTGNGLDNMLTGNDATNSLVGGGGNDTLDGAGGADTLDGGTGNDTYIVGAGDKVVESSARGGSDTVRSSVSHVLGANVEHLILTGADAIDGTGNSLDNRITGNDAANVLNGGGGSDTMEGGAGSDIYIVGSGDKVVEASASGGIDTVRSTVTFALGANVENLVLGGTGAIGGTGNSLANVLTGNAAANLLDGAAGADSMSGGDGDDVYVVDAGDKVVESSATGGTDTVRSAVSYSLGSNVENLVLTGTAAIGGTGNSLDNILTGNGAANLLNGGAGADTMNGGGGDDTYSVGTGDKVVETSATGGTDTVRSGIDYTLGANVENLVLIGTSSLDGTGNSLANVLTGNSGSNILDGAAGVDTMIGGDGNDSYAVGAGDKVVESSATGGTDTVRSSVSYVLGSNLENLVLTGTAAINGTGNSLANALTGNGAANALNGGAGADTMTGGGGDDTYSVGTGDTVVETSATGGVDTVRSGIDYALGAYVENLVLIGTSSLDGSGNSLNNILTGNVAANLLNGAGGNDQLDGGAGADTMNGGTGDDRYVVDHSGDKVAEAASAGTDTVQSSVAFTLGAEIENLILVGTAAIGGTGNALANRITGNSGANLLTGGGGDDWLDGGAGADQMDGGLGDDTFVVDNSGDRVVEQAGGGTDTVRSSVSFVLGGTLERLVLTGTAAANGTGNGLANQISGNSAANLLDGGGGADRLTGGLGDDRYVVDNAGDLVIEAASAGTDHVQSMVGHTLASNVEHLTLAGAASINGRGNGLDNHIEGNGAANILYGLAGHDRLDGKSGADQMIGGLGNDTYFIDNAGDSVVEAFGEGADAVNSALSHTLGDNVEHLVLTGSAATGTGNGLDNHIQGNSLGNTLSGLDGNDRLFGGGGSDVLRGGAGDDIYTLTDSDQVVEELEAGFDTVLSGLMSYTLAANVEQLTLGDGALNGTGNGLANVINGNSGANILNGGGGDDEMHGGDGDDVYMVDSAGDLAIDHAGDGQDTVMSSVSATIIGWTENLTLTGAAVTGTGNAIGNRLTGNANANTLSGGEGDDRLDGAGGADQLIGGGDDDHYLIDALDTVVEEENGGSDTIEVGFSYALGEFLENLVLTGTAAIDGTGNGAFNIITGNSAANLIDGAAAADLMLGGLGNDIYLVDDVFDMVEEGLEGGTDTVRTSVSFTLSANVENAEVIGSEAATLLGNDSANSLKGGGANDDLRGEGGDDILDGGGGGFDILRGGAGDDRYLVHTAETLIVEQEGEGVDTVVHDGFEFALAAGVENLEMSRVWDGSLGVTVTGVGNALANSIIGSGGVNSLSGEGGTDLIYGRGGQDVLAGGAGADGFVFDHALGNGYAELTDIAPEDRIHLSRSVFGAIASDGILAESAFWWQDQALNSEHRILLDFGGSAVYYDPDGSGAATRVLIAIVSSDTILTRHNFEVYSTATPAASAGLAATPALAPALAAAGPAAAAQALAPAGPAPSPAPAAAAPEGFPAGAFDSAAAADPAAFIEAALLGTGARWDLGPAPVHIA
ncbi:MAG TPA: nidogen-like domain-containing protein [Allosphingosinicella sp.]|nr:nidogen-like domain-containing protein [Allosphingosinicella sp.]